MNPTLRAAHIRRVLAPSLAKLVIADNEEIKHYTVKHRPSDVFPIQESTPYVTLGSCYNNLDYAIEYRDRVAKLYKLDACTLQLTTNPQG